MDRNGNYNTHMIAAADEIDAAICSLIGKEVMVFVAKGKYTETVHGVLKAYDGKKALITDAKCSAWSGVFKLVTCFLNGNSYIAGEWYMPKQE